VRRFMELRPFVLLATVLAIVPARPLALGEPVSQGSAPQVTQSVTATATFGPRTSLQVSSQVLQFHVTDAWIPAEATVEFAAGARTRSGGEVLLVVQVRDPERLWPETAGQSLTIVAGTEGTMAGSVVHDAPAVAARWIGGGLRTGRVTFRLQAAPGQYTVPVTFLLNLS
jgi:hypothetical protein